MSKQSLSIVLAFHLLLGLVITLSLFHPILVDKNEVTRGIAQSMKHR